MNEKEGEEFMFGIRKMTKTKYTTLDDVRFKFTEEFSTYELTDEDVLVVTYPKSGTSWMKRILSLLKADGDVERAEKERVDKYMPIVELEGLPSAEASQEPRCISTHLNYRYLPESVKKGKGKVIYVARNPKDAVVSNYFYWKAFALTQYNLSFENFFEHFLNGYVPLGSWDDHVRSYWENRNDVNLLYLKYEDLHQDLEGKVSEIAAFLGKELTPGLIRTIATHSRFDKVKNNPAANFDWWDKKGLIDKSISPFMRKGEIGDWKNYLTPQMSKVMDEIVEKKLQPVGLNFRYE